MKNFESFGIHTRLIHKIKDIKYDPTFCYNTLKEKYSGQFRNDELAKLASYDGVWLLIDKPLGLLQLLEEIKKKEMKAMASFMKLSSLYTSFKINKYLKK